MVTIRLIESNVQAIHTSQSVLTPLNPQFQADLFLVLALHVLRDGDMPNTVSAVTCCSDVAFTRGSQSKEF